MTPGKPLLAFYINGAVREIIPIYPLYAVMFTEHGVTPFYLSILFAIWSVTGFVVEVPSGALADRFSRKWLIVASSLFKSLAFLTWYLEQNFVGYALGFILWGTGSSLRSGAWEALLYDLLKKWDSDQEFARHYGRIKAVTTSGVVAGELLGGLLIVNGYDFVLLVSMVIPIIAAIPFAILVQDVPAEEYEELHYLDLLKAGIRETIDNAAIRYVFLATTLLLITWGIYEEYVGPYLFESGMTLTMIGFVAAALTFSWAAGEWISHQFDTLPLPGLLSMIAVAGLALLTAFFLSGYWIPLVLAVYFFLCSTSGVQFMARLQKQIEGAARATTTSTIGLGESVGAIIWYLAFGAIAEISLATATAALAAVTLFLCALFHFLARHWAVDL